MKKVPTVFRRNPDDMRHVLPEVHPDCQWVLDGEGVATRKYDGTCVLIRRDGLAVKAFVRREVKRGKEPPPGFVEVEHDPTTGKTVGWEPAERSGFARYLDEALQNARPGELVLGTYELCGPKVNGNPEQLSEHRLFRHGEAPVDLVLSGPEPFGPVAQAFEFVRARVVMLGTRGVEGIVWHHPDGRMAKIKARDFPREASDAG